MPSTIRLVVSGGILFLQALDFRGTRPPQLVAGTGGSKLETVAPDRAVPLRVNGAEVAKGITAITFGYVVWDKEATTKWTGTFFDDDGAAVIHCTLDDCALACKRSL